MNTTIRSTVLLVAMFGVDASAQEANCQSTMSFTDAIAAMGAGVAAQPVFKGDGVIGFRLYNTHRSDQLTRQAIKSGNMMTHVCGVPASEIYVRGGSICCKSDASRGFEVTFQIAGETRKIVIRRDYDPSHEN